MKTALITGVNGQDGSHLADLLLSKGYRVVGMLRTGSDPDKVRLRDAANNPHFSVKPGNITKLADVEQIVRETKADEVYNLAAQSNVADSWKFPGLTASVNGVGTCNLLSVVAVHTPNARVFHASSSEMFGAPTTPTQDEDTPLRPLNPYGISKVLAHQMANVFRANKRLFVSCGILYNHEGPRRGDQFVTRKITRTVVDIVTGKASELRLGNLDSPRDWGYAPEYVRAMWQILQANQPDDFVIGTGKTHTVREFVAAAFKAAGIEDWGRYIVVDPAFFRPVDPHTLAANPAKIQRVIGWKAETPFESLVRKMVEEDAKKAKLKLPV